jgi:hypothetical protein
MRFGRFAPAAQAGLLRNLSQMLFIAQPTWRANQGI